jgi:hypothetical protein
MRITARSGLGMLALLGATALLVAGCGSKAKPLSKAQYNTQMTAVGRSLSTSINGLSSVTTAQAGATVMTRVQADLRDAVEKLKKITPPDDVKDAHKRLITAVGDFADALDPLIQKLKAGNLQAMSQLTTLKQLTEIQKAADAISKAGYKISG